MSLYSPVIVDSGGAVTVELGEDHPGFRDPDYRERRNELASLSVDWKPGDRVPEAAYTDVENRVWRDVSENLEPRHDKFACESFLEAKALLALPTDHIPQLDEVTAKLEPITGFRYKPVAGLAPLREFYGSFDDDTFFSTQYIRHHSMPLYTPEPDICHEVIGHANQLADPRFAGLYREVGKAVERATEHEALRFLSKVFWFTMEFGVVRERGEWRAYGAGILSSFGETEAFRKADIRPFDFKTMGTLEYDITRYQPVLFGADSMDELFSELGRFFATFDDAAHRLLCSLPDGRSLSA